MNKIFKYWTRTFITVFVLSIGISGVGGTIRDAVDTSFESVGLGGIKIFMYLLLLIIGSGFLWYVTKEDQDKS